MMNDDLGQTKARAGTLDPPDNWKHRSTKMRCASCMWFVPKAIEGKDGVTIGRCRKHAPTMNGWPVLFPGDWCGDHKIDETKL